MPNNQHSNSQLQQRLIQCPYCWEVIEVLLEPSKQEQRYIEDCQVCCRPIEFHIAVSDDGELLLDVKSEDD